MEAYESALRLKPDAHWAQFRHAMARHQHGLLSNGSLTALGVSPGPSDACHPIEGPSHHACRDPSLGQPPTIRCGAGLSPDLTCLDDKHVGSNRHNPMIDGVGVPAYSSKACSETPPMREEPIATVGGVGISSETLDSEAKRVVVHGYQMCGEGRWVSGELGGGSARLFIAESVLEWHEKELHLVMAAFVEERKEADAYRNPDLDLDLDPPDTNTDTDTDTDMDTNTDTDTDPDRRPLYTITKPSTATEAPISCPNSGAALREAVLQQ